MKTSKRNYLLNFNSQKKSANKKLKQSGKCFFLNKEFCIKYAKFYRGICVDKVEVKASLKMQNQVSKQKLIRQLKFSLYKLACLTMHLAATRYKTALVCG